jgi:NADPH:quinone reductase
MRGFVTDPAEPEGIRWSEDLPEPEPAANEFLLDVRAYAINPGERRLIEARSRDWRPGQDVAGVVVAAAQDGSGPPVGARVVAVVDWHGWAERVQVPTGRAALIEDHVTFEQAASLPIAGLTALRAVREGGSIVGRNVLVTGATGGVGHLSVQIAKASGARVTALVSSEQRVGDALALGADDAITTLDGYQRTFWLVVDAVGGPVLTQAVRHMEPEATAALCGTLGGPTELSLRDFAASTATNARIVGVVHSHPPHTKGQDLAVLADLVARGLVVPRLGLVRDWKETPDALAALGARAFRGKAILTQTEERSEL